MDTRLTVRPLAAHDRSAWDELWAIYLDHDATSVDDATTELTWRRVLRREDGMGGIVCWDTEVVGLAHHVIHPHTWGTGDVCSLEGLVVYPDHRGAGVGRALIEALELRASELGCDTVNWVTEGDNAVARRLYDRIGTLSSYVRYEIDLRSSDDAEGS